MTLFIGWLAWAIFTSIPKIGTMDGFGLFWSLWGQHLTSQKGQSLMQELERLRIGRMIGYFGFLGSTVDHLCGVRRAFKGN